MIFFYIFKDSDTINADPQHCNNESHFKTGLERQNAKEGTDQMKEEEDEIILILIELFFDCKPLQFSVIFLLIVFPFRLYNCIK